MDGATLSADGIFVFGISIKSMLTLLALSSLRIYASMLVLPATGDTVLTGSVRAGIALTLGVFIAWGQPGATLNGLSEGVLVGLLFKEALIGTLLGFAAATVFWVAEGVGMLVDNQAGYNNVQQTNPLNGQQSTPVGNLLLQLAIAGFYLLGGLMAYTSLLIDSFRWWPLHAVAPDTGALLERFLQTQVTSYSQAVVKLAFPLVIALVMIDLGIGLIAKTADKLEPNNLGQPIKGAVALLMLAMFIALFFEQVQPQLALHDLARDLSVWFVRAAPR
jgi:type III secretion protein T